jgi:amino acid transporter
VPITKQHVKLGQLATTAICGNDILSSVLYTGGLVTVSAGKAAPVCLILVSVVLYLFRWIYGEAILAIPLNGGCYSVLINTTSKAVASIAAALGVLSYIATGVVSAASACYYLQSVLPHEEFDVVLATLMLLFAFAILCAFGISESAAVASVIFVVHVVTLTMLCAVCTAYAVANSGGELWDNLMGDYPNVVVARETYKGGLTTAIFFGFCTAMLGVSGFETSSQFVQVTPKNNKST